jgi:hypothetical protein
MRNPIYILIIFTAYSMPNPINIRITFTAISMRIPINMFAILLRNAYIYRISHDVSTNIVRLYIGFRML